MECAKRLAVIQTGHFDFNCQVNKKKTRKSIMVNVQNIFQRNNTVTAESFASNLPPTFGTKFPLLGYTVPITIYAYGLYMHENQ